MEGSDSVDDQGQVALDPSSEQEEFPLTQAPSSKGASASIVHSQSAIQVDDDDSLQSASQTTDRSPIR